MLGRFLLLIIVLSFDFSGTNAVSSSTNERIVYRVNLSRESRWISKVIHKF